MLTKLSFVVSMVQVCWADMIESPARLRVNSDLIKSIFHSGDQRILENFNNLTFSQED